MRYKVDIIIVACDSASYLFVCVCLCVCVCVCVHASMHVCVGMRVLNSLCFLQCAGLLLSPQPLRCEHAYSCVELLLHIINYNSFIPHHHHHHHHHHHIIIKEPFPRAGDTPLMRASLTILVLDMSANRVSSDSS